MAKNISLSESEEKKLRFRSAAHLSNEDDEPQRYQQACDEQQHSQRASNETSKNQTTLAGAEQQGGTQPVPPKKSRCGRTVRFSSRFLEGIAA